MSAMLAIQSLRFRGWISAMLPGCAPSGCWLKMRDRIAMRISRELGMRDAFNSILQCPNLVFSAPNCVWALGELFVRGVGCFRLCSRAW